jgi:hypothetical protein
MVGERLLKGYPTGESAEPDNVEDQGCYGVLRATRDRVPMIEFRKKDGSALAVAYAMIEQISCSTGDGILVRAAGREIRILGRSLGEETSAGLFRALVRQRVCWVQERGRSATLGAEGSVVVEAIQW